MAYSTELLSDIKPFGGVSYADLEARGAPLLLGHNALRKANSIQWRSALSWEEGIDVTLTPTSRLYDGYTHLPSEPSAAAETNHLMVSWPASAPASFDTLVIIGHNFQSFTDNSQQSLLVAVSDVANFATWFVICNKPVLNDTGDSIIFTSLTVPPGSDAVRFSNVQYFMMEFYGSSAVLPKIGEIYLGCRRSLPRLPDEPWDPNKLHSEASEFRSLSGIMSRSVMYRGQRVIDASITTTDAEEAAELDGFWADTKHGRHPFVWYVPTPGKDGLINRPHLMAFDHLDWEGPHIGPFEREFRISASEQGPFFSSMLSDGATI